MSPREQRLWNQFRASLEMAAERDRRRGWDVAVATSILVPWEDMWPSKQQEEKTGGSLFFLPNSTSVIWARMATEDRAGGRCHCPAWLIRFNIKLGWLSAAIRSKRRRNDISEERRNWTVKRGNSPKIDFSHIQYSLLDGGRFVQLEQSFMNRHSQPVNLLS